MARCSKEVGDEVSIADSEEVVVYIAKKPPETTVPETEPPVTTEAETVPETEAPNETREAGENEP